jgi:hypothetical protein
MSSASAQLSIQPALDRAICIAVYSPITRHMTLMEFHRVVSGVTSGFEAHGICDPLERIVPAKKRSRMLVIIHVGREHG